LQGEDRGEEVRKRFSPSMRIASRLDQLKHFAAASRHGSQQ
jgi:hypothetical protein